MEKKDYYVIKRLNEKNEWKTIALIENNIDAVFTGRLFRDQMGYTVQLLHSGEDKTFLLGGRPKTQQKGIASILKNIIFFENGIRHDLTPDEITVLKIALNDFNECSLPMCSEERDAEYMAALARLKSLFLENLD